MLSDKLLISECEDYFNPTVVIIGVMAAVVGIGIAALLIWKGYTSMKDAAEYKNFIRESQNVKFEGVRKVVCGF